MTAITKYLLPCQCGQKISVEMGQAGQSVQCQCGKTVEVPSMRGVRALETIQVATEKRVDHRETNWNPSRGILFSLCIVVGVASFAFALYNFRALQNIGDIYTEDEVTALFDEAIDEFDAEQAFDVWRELRTRGIGSRTLPPYVFWARHARHLKITIAISLLVGLVAMGAAIATVTVSRKASVAGKT